MDAQKKVYRQKGVRTVISHRFRVHKYMNMILSTQYLIQLLENQIWRRLYNPGDLGYVVWYGDIMCKYCYHKKVGTVVDSSSLYMSLLVSMAPNLLHLSILQNLKDLSWPISFPIQNQKFQDSVHEAQVVDFMPFIKFDAKMWFTQHYCLLR